MILVGQALLDYDDDALGAVAGWATGRFMAREDGPAGRALHVR